jgi:hypothetical protein
MFAVPDLIRIYRDQQNEHRSLGGNTADYEPNNAEYRSIVFCSDDPQSWVALALPRQPYHKKAYIIDKTGTIYSAIIEKLGLMNTSEPDLSLIYSDKPFQSKFKSCWTKESVPRFYYGE